MPTISQPDSFITEEIRGSSSRKHRLQVCRWLLTSAWGKREAYGGKTLINNYAIKHWCGSSRPSKLCCACRSLSRSECAGLLENITERRQTAQWIYDKNTCMHLCSTPWKRWIAAEQQGCRSHLLVKNVQSWFKPFKVQKGTKIQAQTWQLPYVRVFFIFFLKKYWAGVGGWGGKNI